MGEMAIWSVWSLVIPECWSVHVWRKGEGERGRCQGFGGFICRKSREEREGRREVERTWEGQLNFEPRLIFPPTFFLLLALSFGLPRLANIAVIVFRPSPLDSSSFPPHPPSRPPSAALHLLLILQPQAAGIEFLTSSNSENVQEGFDVQICCQAFSRSQGREGV